MTPVFVDTNVLVYLRDSTEPEKQRAAAEWVAYLWDTGAGRLSTQVLGCHDRGRRPAAVGCRTLLTEDLQHGQDMGDLVIRSPFTTPPPQ